MSGSETWLERTQDRERAAKTPQDHSYKAGFQCKGDLYGQNQRLQSPICGEEKHSCKCHHPFNHEVYINKYEYVSAI